MLIIIANPSMSKAENYCPNKASFKKYFDMSASLGIVDVCQKKYNITISNEKALFIVNATYNSTQQDHSYYNGIDKLYNYCKSCKKNYDCQALLLAQIRSSSYDGHYNLQTRNCELLK